MLKQERTIPLIGKGEKLKKAYTSIAELETKNQELQEDNDILVDALNKLGGRSTAELQEELEAKEVQYDGLLEVAEGNSLLMGELGFRDHDMPCSSDKLEEQLGFHKETKDDLPHPIYIKVYKHKGKVHEIYMYHKKGLWHILRGKKSMGRFEVYDMRHMKMLLKMLNVKID